MKMTVLFGKALSSLLFVALVSLPSTAQERPKDDPNPLTETQRIQHVLSRFAFGPGPGLVERVRKQGLEKWFEEQIQGQVQTSQMLQDWLAAQGSINMTSQEILNTYNRVLPRNAPRKEVQKRNRMRNTPRLELQDAVLYRAIFGRNQVKETACDFFRNHFNIDINKGNVRYYATEYEREVIRKGVFGKFEDILLGSATHPAMLFYLDNYISRRPPTRQELKVVARRVRRKTKSKERAEESVEIAKQRGLNENYARELLELHTLGVDNYYRQKDVIAVAEALTGWTIQQDRKKPIVFTFRKDMHQKGDKYFLKRKIKGNRKDPLREGLAVIKRLAAHKGTAQFIALKLCQFYVDDDPPKRMVDRVATAFRKSKGKLSSVYQAIFKDPDFFSPRHFQSKFKRPFEYVVSAIRITGAELRSPRGLQSALRGMSEEVYRCQDPTGYYDKAEAWNDPGVMAQRWKFAMDLVQGRIPGVKIPRSFYEDLRPDLPQVWKEQMAKKILAAGLSERSSAALDRQVRAYLQKNKKPKIYQLAPLILGMLLGSPEFQRQ